ncbi:hypothetical protein F5888DRAFT_1951006 [Russula emetica]|nr:hypothetical protein F5888DRAFT_1951006 [Russula emetica]
MIGDFDGSSNALWTLFRDEAKSDDDARMGTLKDDMESSLIFAGLFSAALTAFVVDSKQNLTPSPADETVYYLRQQSTILSQISVQLSSIAPQVSIPSTPPAPFPVFNPSASDVRVNVFWFMSLVFSLLAALLAILVQQWVRDYMHVFQRYGDPLKSSRLRQYLYEGCDGWYMPMVAEAVPGFLHLLPVPILCRAWRLATKYQHKSSSEYHYSHRRQRPPVHLHDICAHHISAIALPEFIFRHFLVFVSEGTRPEIQGSWIQWRNEICEHEHGTGTDAASNGRDGGTQGPRRTGDSMVDRQPDGGCGNGKVFISYTWLV